ncbi:hypothetical protein L1987_18664 [Smallanthus sonchifolius]|uniref:Uncharacterized protein n=1 Tax=Smallanthus sonchifolius TaxID=185202 RepID=A0ACB9J0V8_9ASTR|nr:hypothetical protein L1987_18664 [Smallanthus sonchifolius]
MCLQAESLSTKLDARTPSSNKKDHKSDATSLYNENTVSAHERLELPKPRTRENARKKTLVLKLTFETMEKGKPSTRAPLTPSPQDSSRDYIQLYRYFNRKDEVNESLGWLTSRGKDMKAHIMLNLDKTIAAIKEVRAAKIQSRVAIAVALVVSIASLLFSVVPLDDMCLIALLYGYVLGIMCRNFSLVVLCVV